MYQNAFEALRAPTNYNTRDISRHIQLLLAEGATRDMTEPHRLTLLSAATRLDNELLTLRGADYEEELPEQERQYLAVLTKTLSGSSLQAIVPEAAAEWIRNMQKKKYQEAQNSKSNLKKSIKNSEDKWLIQGAAAICTRTAIEAETKDEARALTAWKEALGWWQKFFSLAAVEESYAYIQQSDERGKEECRERWENFLRQLIEDLYSRCTKDYILQNDGKAVNACLHVLRSADVRLIDPKIYDRAIGSIEPSIAAGLLKSTSLREALSLWEGLPEFFREKPSIVAKMFSAMATEAGKVEKGYGDVPMLVATWEKLGGDSFGEDTNIEIRAALEKYREEVRITCLNLASDEEKMEDEKRKKEVISLLDHLPPQQMIAKDPAGTVITAEMFRRGLDRKTKEKELVGCLDAFIKSGVTDSRAIEAFERLVQFVRRNAEDFQEDPVAREAIEQLMKEKLIRAANNCMDTQNENAKKLAFKIISYLPESTQIPVGTDKIVSVKALAEMIVDSQGERELFNLLNAFFKSDVRQSRAEEDLYALMDFVRENWTKVRENEEASEAIQNVLKEKLIQATNIFMEFRDSQARNLGLAIIEELPPETLIRSGESEMISIESLKFLLGGTDPRRTLPETRGTLPKKRGNLFEKKTVPEQKTSPGKQDPVQKKKETFASRRTRRFEPRRIFYILLFGLLSFLPMFLMFGREEKILSFPIFVGIALAAAAISGAVSGIGYKGKPMGFVDWEKSRALTSMMLIPSLLFFLSERVELFEFQFGALTVIATVLLLISAIVGIGRYRKGENSLGVIGGWIATISGWIFAFVLVREDRLILLPIRFFGISLPENLSKGTETVFFFIFLAYAGQILSDSLAYLIGRRR